MTQSASVSSQQRFRRYGEHCPICGGHSGLKQGRGERCAGYLSSDEEYAFCTREEYAGQLERNETTEPATFCHKLYGPCNCGTEHNPAKASSNGHKTERPKQQITEFPYLDERGRLAYVTVRYDLPDGSKNFKQKQPKGKDWAWNLQGVTRIPYRLPELLKTPLDTTVFICEGEKAAESARHLGVVATTNVCGAGKWTESCNKYFKGRRVGIIPDNDEKGRAHAQKVAENLTDVAASIKIVELLGLPEKGDIVEWIAAGGTREQLEQMAAPTKRKFLYASEVKTEPVDYLWTKRLARGMLTLLVGDPGLGKSMLTSKLIASVTTGGVLPDGKAIAPGGVVVMAPEDSYEHTIVPRLIAAGADLSKVILLSEVSDFDNEGKPYNRPISFPEDAGILEEAIIDCKASLAVIDPVLAMVNGKYDSHKDQEARAALGRVLSVADRQNCALLGIFHLNKTQSGNVLYRSAASIAFIAMARIGLFLVPDPDNPENGRVLVNHKNNLAAKSKSLCFSIEQTADEIGYVEWQGESPYTEDQLLNQATPTDNPKSEQETRIIEILKENRLPMTVNEIYTKLGTEKSSDAVEKMLNRKANQGILIRPARGLYTWNGNPLYSAKTEATKEGVGSVGSVGSVNDVGSVLHSNIAFGDMSESMSTTEAASDEAGKQTDISDIKNYVGIDVGNAKVSISGHVAPSHNENHKPVEPTTGQIIARMIAQGYGYPKKCANPSHRGETRWMPQQNPETGKWDRWYCCKCEEERQGKA